MKLLFLTVSLVTAFASEPGDSGSFTKAQSFPHGPGDYSYVDEALQMMGGRLVVADDQNNPIYPKTGDMSMLLSRSKWCRSRDGECRRRKFSCPHKYESPYGRPYCTSKKRRCCYPGKGPTSTTPTPSTGPTSPTPTPKCPEGLFRAGYSQQCFLFLMDIQRNWTDAKKKCENEGYSLAEPQEPLAVRSYIVNTYDPYWSTWLGAQGDGSSLRWLRSGEAISNSDPLWRKGDPGVKVTPDDKLVLSWWRLSQYPKTPFKSFNGGYTRNTLCELVLN